METPRGTQPGAKQELLRQAEQEYDGLKAAIKGLDEAQMSTVWLGSWGVREIVAHISGWHREMIPALERLHRGEAPYPDGAYDDFDTWNARFVEAYKGQDAADIVRALDASHRELLSAASRLPDEQFAEGKPVLGLVDGVTAGHYREHAEQIRQWRQR
jgi:hypothetical protein